MHQNGLPSHGLVIEQIVATWAAWHEVKPGRKGVVQSQGMVLTWVGAISVLPCAGKARKTQQAKGAPCGRGKGKGQQAWVLHAGRKKKPAGLGLCCAWQLGRAAAGPVAAWAVGLLLWAFAVAATMGFILGHFGSDY